MSNIRQSALKFFRIYTISILSLLTHESHIVAFSSPLTSFSSDRFTATCPADVNCIRQFDQRLVEDVDENDVWVAVYRSNNNMPSVMLRDELFDSMRIATSAIPVSNFDEVGNEKIETKQGFGVKARAPVAIGRLRTNVDEDRYLIDYLRCSLEKENTNNECEGGSEHTEALSVCIDELILQYLRTNESQELKHGWKNFLRCKATLVSGVLFEKRGFVPVTSFSKDMATHVSWDISLAMERYAMRSTSSNGKIPERTLQILSLLGNLDEKDDVNSSPDGNEDEDYDPWASMKKYI